MNKAKAIEISQLETKIFLFINYVNTWASESKLNPRYSEAYKQACSDIYDKLKEIGLIELWKEKKGWKV